MQCDVTAENKDSMNAEYNGRISVMTSYTLTTIADTLKLIPKVTERTGLYEVSHADAEITYTSEEEAINNLKETELRFAGSDPNNYVNFNNELWRVIGLVNTPESQRVKLIRNENIGAYSWDSSASSVNSGYGINEWSTSKMMNLLNYGSYYNRTSGTCYNGQNNATTACDFTNTGLTNNAKDTIDTVTWNLGSNGNVSYDSINTKSFYNLERSSNTGKNCSGGNYCNDSVARTTTWLGSVGLMYPSDYGYATSGGDITNRSTCLNKALNLWGADEVNDCKSNNWIYKSEISLWTMMPATVSGDGYSTFGLNYRGYVGYTRTVTVIFPFPTIYL